MGDSAQNLLSSNCKGESRDVKFFNYAGFEVGILVTEADIELKQNRFFPVRRVI